MRRRCTCRWQCVALVVAVSDGIGPSSVKLNNDNCWGGGRKRKLIFSRHCWMRQKGDMVVEEICVDLFYFLVLQKKILLLLVAIKWLDLWVVFTAVHMLLSDYSNIKIFVEMWGFSSKELFVMWLFVWVCVWMGDDELLSTIIRNSATMDGRGSVMN